MGKQSMTELRERRAERGLVQVNFWIREEDRAAFEVAVAPFKDRASKLDPAHKPGRRPLEAVRGSLLGGSADQDTKAAQTLSEARRTAISSKAGHCHALPPHLSGRASSKSSQRDEG